MRRNAFFRGLAGVLSVWLAICLAEPAQLHTCVMHGGLAIDAHVGGSHHGIAHAADAASNAVAGHSHDQQSDEGKAKQCSCLGDCSAGRTLIGVAPAAGTFTAPTIHTGAAVFSYASPSIVAPHFLLPFSNGPPDASSRA